jgi:ABC-type sulfate transport system substrate-binding protein
MAKNDIWVTRDGNRVKMQDMTDTHLKNAIKYFKPNPKSSGKTTAWKLLTTEAKRRKWKITNNGTKNGIDNGINIDMNEPDEPIDNRFDILDL